MASAKALGHDWLNDTLSADATLTGLVEGVWPGENVPSGITGVYVVHEFVSSVVLRVIGPIRFWHDTLWQIKCVGPANRWSEIVAAANRVDALLEMTQDPPAVVCELEGEVPVPPDVYGGEVYENISSRWRIKIQE